MTSGRKTNKKFKKEISQSAEALQVLQGYA